MLKFAASKARVAESDDEVEEIFESELNDGIVIASDEENDDEAVEPARVAEAAPAPAPARRGFFSSFFSGSSNRAESAAPPPPLGMSTAPALRPRPAPKPKKVVAKQKVSANVAAVDFASLSVAAPLCAASPFSCSGCTALLTSISQLEASEASETDGAPGASTWKCEFCGVQNEVPEDCQPDDVLSANATVDFVLEPAPVAETEAELEGELEEGEGATGAAAAAAGEPFVYFAIDTSGSMALTQNVPGLTAEMLNGDETSRRAQLQAEISEMEGLKQALPADEHEEINRVIARLRNKMNAPQRARPSRSRGTHVSRLAAVRMALQQQLSDIHRDSPSMRVGLMTFANDVQVHGDSGTRLKGSQTLNDEGTLRALASDLSDGTRRIGDEGAADALKTSLAKLRPGGKTALGPALVAAIEMASAQRGSKVVICTDGVANVGVGRLDAGVNDEVEEFYENAGDYAAVKGVSVDVITLADEECRVEQLGIVADRSGGRVDRVDLLRIREGFKSAASVPVATGVEVTILCHQALRIELADEAAAQQEHEGNRVTRVLGNVTRDARFYFEYSTNKEVVQQPEHSELQQVPFQIQVRFTRPDGARVMRVIAAQQEVTREAEEQQQQVCNMDVLAAHLAQRSAHLAHEGDYESSRLVNAANAKFLRRVAKTDAQRAEVSAHVQRAQQWDRSLLTEQQRELDMPLASAGLGGGKLGKKKARARRRNDAISSQLYAMKKGY